MDLIDFILNLAGLLLWLSWRSTGFDPLVKTTPATLVGTLRRAEPPRFKHWHLLAALGALLFLRALVYWQVGSAVDWTPKLRLGAIAISFRSDFAGLALLFSALSFGVTLAVFYLWLLLLSLANGNAPDAGPLQRLAQLHLGRIARWSWPARLLLPLAVIVLLWFPLSLLLARLQLLPPAISAAHRLEQAVVIALGSYLSWKYPIGILLALYLLGSYVYFGNQPFWNFAAVTGRNLLRPLRWAPLRLGKLDLAPLVEIALVFLTAELAERGLTLLYQRLPVG